MTPENDAAREADALRESIEETRAELGQTVEALAEKADVKAQVKEKVDERKEQLRETQHQAQAKIGDVGEQAKQNRVPVIAGAAGVLLLVLLLLRSRS